LAGDCRHGDVQDVEVLLADQVEQQIQRPFEGFEEDLERIGRDVQVLRELEQRLAVQACERDLVDDLGRRRRVSVRGGVRSGQTLPFGLSASQPFVW